MTPYQNYLYSLSVFIGELVTIVAIAIAASFAVRAVVCKDKDRRRLLLRRAGIALLAIPVSFGSHCASLLMFYAGEPTLEAISLFVAVMGVIAAGLLFSLFALCSAIGRKKGEQRAQLATTAMIGLAVFAAGLVPPGIGILIQGANKQEYANRPGTLVRVGELAPDFSITDIDGAPFRCSDCRGKVLLVNFFATWCVPCRKELPHLQAIWDEFGNNGAFRLLVIGREETNETVTAFRLQYRFGFPMASDEKMAIYGQFASQYIPRTFLIGRDGRIIYEATGFDEGEIRKLKALVRKEVARKG